MRSRRSNIIAVRGKQKKNIIMTNWAEFLRKKCRRWNQTATAGDCLPRFRNAQTSSLITISLKHINALFHRGDEFACFFRAGLFLETVDLLAASREWLGTDTVLCRPLLTYPNSTGVEHLLNDNYRGILIGTWCCTQRQVCTLNFKCMGIYDIYKTNLVGCGIINCHLNELPQIFFTTFL